jgi:hypothetical protein
VVWQARWGTARFNAVWWGGLGHGRLGEVGIGVVCKVLSGRQGGVRSYWVRRDLTRFGVAGMVSEVWIDKTQLGMVRCGSFWQVWRVRSVTAWSGFSGRHDGVR